MTHTFKDCRCIKETSLAILVVDAMGSEAWVPLSQINDDSEVYSEDTVGDLIMSRWFAKKIDWVEK